MHGFDEKRAIEDRWSAVLDGWLLESGHATRRATRAEEWEGADRVTLGGPDGAGIRIEYKCDERAGLTGNLFIETVSNDRTGRPGWAHSCRSDFLLYLVVPSTVLVFRPSCIRAALDGWALRYPTRAADNGGYRTLGVYVPIHEAAERCEYVAHLDLGDGCVLQAAVPSGSR